MKLNQNCFKTVVVILLFFFAVLWCLVIVCCSVIVMVWWWWLKIISLSCSSKVGNAAKRNMQPSYLEETLFITPTQLQLNLNPNVAGGWT